MGRPQNWGYPIRGIVTDDYLYLYNAEPSRWPAGNPETGYLDTDGSPTKSLILDLGRANRADHYWQLNFGLRPSDELYNLRSDRDCVRNLATESEETVRLLRQRMETILKVQGDPRMFGQGHVFDEYKPTNGDGFYEKLMRGEKVEAGWVEPTDFEKKPLVSSGLSKFRACRRTLIAHRKLSKCEPLRQLTDRKRCVLTDSKLPIISFSSDGVGSIIHDYPTELQFLVGAVSVSCGMLRSKHQKEEATR